MQLEDWGIGATPNEETLMSESKDLSKLSDEELVARFRELKSEVGGADPGLSPPDDGAHGQIREEMERRGLAPDREDMIPDDKSSTADPIVEDHA
jgi:hypothetical protein